MLIPKQNFKSLYYKDYTVSSGSVEAMLFHCNFQMKFRNLTENNFLLSLGNTTFPLPGFASFFFPY